MKDWFKARNIWGAAITALSDEEAGRLAKAIWAYTMDGEIVDIDGAGKGIFAMILMTLGQDEEKDADISAKRSKATDSIREQKTSNDIKCNQMISNDIKPNQLISNDDNKNKNKNKNKNIEQESESSSFIADADARMIQREQDQVMNAAEDAGFKMSNGVRATLVRLYSEHGLQKMTDGFAACVKHGVPTLAYLEAVLKGKPKQPRKTVTAQQYEQRDYGDIDAELQAQQEREMEEFMRSERGAS